MITNTITDELEEVEQGHLVRWNGRTTPQVVTQVSGESFEVRSHQNSFYKFYPEGRYLINQQSNSEFDIDQFEILGEVYDSTRW